MTINYTTLLGLAQPVTGTEANTWGTVVNDEITALLEEAVAGGETINVAAGDVTLTDTQGTSNQARNAILLVTGSPGVSRNIIAPSLSKVYVVVNGSNAAVVIKGSATTGVSIAAGTKALVAWNGSDFVVVARDGDVAGPSSATDNAIARFDGTTGKLIQNSVVTIADSTGDISGVGQLNATTADLTNLEVTNIKAKDGTSAGSIANSTGIVTLTTVTGTTADYTNVEVTNIKAKDGTAAATIADSTGKITVSTELAVDNLNLSVNTISSTNTNGNIVLSPNGTGKVGVGTASPAVKFEVSEGDIRSIRTSGTPTVQAVSSQASGYAPAFFGLTRYGASGTATPNNSGIGEIRFDGLDSNNAYSNFGFISTTIGTNAAGGAPSLMIFGTASSGATATERMRIDSSGNVGIGTNDPQTGLQVVKNVDGSLAIFQGAQTANPQYLLFRNYFHTNNSTAGTAYVGASDSGSQGGNLLFGTTANSSGVSGTPTERMRINPSGNVGIGTNSPAARLSVKAGSSGDGIFVDRSGASAVTKLQFRNESGTVSTAILNLGTSDGMSFETGGANERMRIHSSGGVSIGNTTDPGATNLSVAGAVVSTRVNPRSVAAAATSGSLTINGDTTDLYKAEGLTGAITFLTPSGTPVDGQKLMIRIKDNGTARGITWTTSAGAFRAIGIALPTTTVLSKVTYVGCVYNATDAYWDAVATVTQL